METEPVAMNEKPKLKRDWKGRKVRLREEIQTKGGTIFPAGMVLNVVQNRSGLTLETVMRCPTCEVSQRNWIKGVGEWKVELLPEGGA
jgi:hypothetical protein